MPPRQAIPVSELGEEILELVEAAEMMTDEPYDLADIPEIEDGENA